jgi:hypothetical protein
VQCRVGVEFDGPAVTSKGAFEDIYCRFVSKVSRLCPEALVPCPADWALYLPLLTWLGSLAVMLH